MLKKVFTICAVSILSCSAASGYEILIDSTLSFSRVVNDPKTNLMWQDDESAKSVTKNWEEAVNYCQNLNLGGYSDWRLPSLEELKTIVDKSHSPAIKSEFKNTASRSYWSSTPSAGGSDVAWNVFFYDGYENDYGTKDNNYNVRCVRDSK